MTLYSKLGTSFGIGTGWSMGLSAESSNPKGYAHGFLLESNGHGPKKNGKGKAYNK